MKAAGSGGGRGWEGRGGSIGGACGTYILGYMYIRTNKYGCDLAGSRAGARLVEFFLVHGFLLERILLRYGLAR